MTKTRTLGIVLFPGFELLDVFGPAEMFGVLRDHVRVVLVAEQPGPVASTQGPEAVAAYGFENCPDLELLLVPGGIGTRREVDNATLIDWVRTRAEQAEVAMTVCTGTAILARTGLLDGYRATSNKRAFDWVASVSDRVEWVRRARWVTDGKFATSSGVSAGMDMALAVIERLYGAEIARAVEIGTEYTRHIDPETDPFADLHR